MLDLLIDANADLSPVRHRPTVIHSTLDSFVRGRFSASR